MPWSQQTSTLGWFQKRETAFRHPPARLNTDTGVDGNSIACNMTSGRSGNVTLQDHWAGLFSPVACRTPYSRMFNRLS